MNDTFTDIERQARIAAFDRGELETHLAEDVFAEARRISK
jgi:hypothetical protein